MSLCLNLDFLEFELMSNDNWLLCFAMQTIIAMHAQPWTTRWALPSKFFVFKKKFNTIWINGIQILQHAHLVSSTVSFIQILKPFTGIFFTLKTKVELITDQNFTIHNLAVHTMSWFCCRTFQTSRTRIPHPQVANACTAVHPTRSNETVINCIF